MRPLYGFRAGLQSHGRRSPMPVLESEGRSKMKLEETVTYLEMNDRGELVPAREPMVKLEVRRAHIPCPELNRFLYTAIGGEWYWIDRLSWTYEQWIDYLNRPGMETWVAYVEGTPA